MNDLFSRLYSSPPADLRPPLSHFSAATFDPVPLGLSLLSRRVCRTSPLWLRGYVRSCLAGSARFCPGVCRTSPLCLRGYVRSCPAGSVSSVPAGLPDIAALSPRLRSILSRWVCLFCPGGSAGHRRSVSAATFDPVPLGLPLLSRRVCRTSPLCLRGYVRSCPAVSARFCPGGSAGYRRSVSAATFNPVLLGLLASVPAGLPDIAALSPRLCPILSRWVCLFCPGGSAGHRRSVSAALSDPVPLGLPLLSRRVCRTSLSLVSAATFDPVPLSLLASVPAGLPDIAALSPRLCPILSRWVCLFCSGGSAGHRRSVSAALSDPVPVGLLASAPAGLPATAALTPRLHPPRLCLLIATISQHHQTVGRPGGVALSPAGVVNKLRKWTAAASCPVFVVLLARLAVSAPLQTLRFTCIWEMRITQSYDCLSSMDKN